MRKKKVTPEDFSQTEKTIRVVMGPQDDCFTEKGVETFLSSTYAFTNESDRMGCRLEGEVIEHKMAAILSQTVSPLVRFRCRPTDSRLS